MRPAPSLSAALSLLLYLACSAASTNGEGMVGGDPSTHSERLAGSVAHLAKAQYGPLSHKVGALAFAHHSPRSHHLAPFAGSQGFCHLPIEGSFLCLQCSDRHWCAIGIPATALIWSSWASCSPGQMFELLVSRCMGALLRRMVGLGASGMSCPLALGSAGSRGVRATLQALGRGATR